MHVSGTPAGQAGGSAATGRRVLVLAFASTMSMLMGVSSVVPMVPLLSKEFGVSLPTASMTITAFTLPGIIFAMLAGILADRYGRKAVLAPSLLLFSLAGGACAIAPNFEILLLLRFLQGTGAASLILLNTTIIADYWSGPERGPHLSRMIGYNMTMLSVGNALYPTIGGFLAHVDWRLPFLLPLLVLPVFFIALGTPLAKPGATVTLKEYFSNLRKIFHDRRIITLCVITTLTFLMLYGPIITCYPILADQRFHANPPAIGIGMIFSALGAAIMAVMLGRLSNRFPPHRLLIASQCLYIAALAVIPQVTNFWHLLPAILVFGLAQGLNVPNVQTQLLRAADAGQRASVMATNAVLQRIGQTAGPMGFSLITVWYGLDAGFHVGILLSVGIIGLAFVLPPPRKAGA